MAKGKSYQRYSASFKKMALTKALRLDEKRKLQDILTHKLIGEAKAEHRKLYMENWSDRNWILTYANAFGRM